MSSLSNKSYFRFLAFMLMVTTYLPLVFYYLPSYIISHHLWAILWMFSLVFFVPQILNNRMFKYVFIYSFTLLLLQYFNFWSDIDFKLDARFFQSEIYVFIIAFALHAYFKVSGDKKGLVQVTKWSLIFIGITALLSIVSSFIDPMYARKLASGVELDSDLILKIGGGSYGFASALVCLFPIMVYFYRDNSQCVFTKRQIIVFGIICFAALVRMQIFANILVSSVVIILSLAGRRSLRKSIGILGIILIIGIIIPKWIYSDLLIQISEYFDKDSTTYYKLTDMSNYIRIGDAVYTGAGSRADRYPMLWDAFITNPFFGHFFTNNTKNIDAGGHMYFMYKLTGWGILNFLFFIFIFIKFINLGLKTFDEKYSFYFLLSIFSIIALGFMKNLVTRELWYTVFFVLPGLYYLKGSKNSKI